MKKILFLFLFPFVLHAESYTFSGGKNNLAHIIAADVLIKAYAKVGISITPKFMNLSDALEQSNAGITDGELARIDKISKFYPNLKKVPIAISSVEAIAFSKNTSLWINKWEDLHDYNVTIIKGANFIETAMHDINHHVVDTFKEALTLLYEDKTQIIVTPKLASLNIIYQEKYHDIKPISNSLKTLQLFHFVNRKNSHLIPIITPTLQKMQNDGSIEFIKKTRLMKEIMKLPKR